MSPRNPAGFGGTIVTAVLAAAALTVQLVTDRPVLGPFSLITLLAPGYLYSRALGPGLQAWPHVVLTTLGASLVLLVVTGIISAGSARGLDASSVAAVELVALIAASGLLRWRWRHDASRPEGLGVRINPASAFLVAGGVALGSIGFAVASNAAREQAALPRFVQFWSVAPSDGTGQVMGVRNATGVTIACAVAIDHLGQRIFDSQIGAIENGQTWTGPLPTSHTTDTSTWQVALHCTGSDGAIFDRRLTIDPPA